MKKIYLDYAASTPVGERVLSAMVPYFSVKYGNPGSLHSFGQEAVSAVDKSRESVGKSIGAGFREVIFTSGATEANNLALRGVVDQFKIQNSGLGIRPKLIVSAVEHESVLDTAYFLERRGVEVVVLPVDENGLVDLEKLEKELNERTVLISVMYVNNETGGTQPIAEIGKMIRNFRNSETASYPLFHTDASQAFMYLDCDVRKLGVDLMTLSGQKIYGPKGIGALYVNSKFLSPQITGGGQEFGLRSGTENVPQIVGLGKAAEIACLNREKNFKHVSKIRDYFWKELKKSIPDAELNLPPLGAPHILNVYFPSEYTGEFLVKLDMEGVAASAGSACSARAFTPSYVLKSMGFPEERVRGSVRFSFGPQTTKLEINEAVRRISHCVIMSV